MRVSAPNRTSLTTGTTGARPLSGGGTFSLGEAQGSQAQSAATALRSLGGIDALLALQGVEDPDVPWRHAVELVSRLASDDVWRDLVEQNLQIIQQMRHRLDVIEGGVFLPDLPRGLITMLIGHGRSARDLGFPLPRGP